VAVLNEHEVIASCCACGPSPGGSGGTAASERVHQAFPLGAGVDPSYPGGGRLGEKPSAIDGRRIPHQGSLHLSFCAAGGLASGNPGRADNSLLLCTVGDDPFQGALESTVAGKAIGDRILRIRHLKQGEDMQACHVLFLGRAQSKRIPTLLANLHNAPILTVGETPGFLGAGGMICFVLEGNNVRFGINLDAAASAKLKIGSRLLILAQTVVGESREK
jgi:hypothetical protein